MTRRELFRRGGTIGAGAAATVGVGSRVAPRFSPVGRAAAIAPAIVIGAAVGTGALSYMAGVAVERYTGDNRDYSGYTGADALHSEMHIGALEMASADERVMTGIENNIEHSRTVAFTKGKAAIIEKMNAGAPESEAQTAMQEAIDGYYSDIQRNILTHVSEQARQTVHFFDQAAAHSNLSPENVFMDSNQTDSWGSPPDFPLTTETASKLTLFDGSQPEYTSISENGGNGPAWPPRSTEGYLAKIGVQAPDGSGTAECFSSYRYESAWNTLTTERDGVNADLSGFVTDIYTQYEPGEIPTDELVDPVTASTELRQNYDNAAGQSAHAALMGIPTSADLSVSMEIVSDEAEDGVWEVTCDMFTDHVPREDVTSSASFSSGILTISTEPVTGATYTLTTAAGETVDTAASSFTDNGDGTWQVDLSANLSTTSTSVETLLGEEVGFQSGNTYQPSTWSDPVYIAYNYTDQNGNKKGAFTQIESEFTLVEVTDSDGNAVETFKPESRNTQTADVSELKKELAAFREEWIKQQEAAQEEDEEEDDGALFGGLFDGGLGGGGMLGLGIIGVAIVAVVGFVTNSGNRL